MPSIETTQSESTNMEKASSFSFPALRSGIQAIAFWSAIALPFLYIPLLFSGLTSTAQILAFVALVALNIAALYFGHRYRQ